MHSASLRRLRVLSRQLQASAVAVGRAPFSLSVPVRAMGTAAGAGAGDAKGQFARVTDYSRFISPLSLKRQPVRNPAHVSTSCVALMCGAVLSACAVRHPFADGAGQ